MDVTNGLISRLVKSKSTARVLAPIASQVALLMILKEVEGEDCGEGSGLNVSACVDRVTMAVDSFIHIGQDQTQHSTDPVFNSQMQAACETLELAKSQLYVAGQTVGRHVGGHAPSSTDSAPSAARSHASLVTAAKDLLQAVLRVLIIVDDVEVRRCVQAVTVVENKVTNICSLGDVGQFVSMFKDLTESMLYLTMKISRRQKDLVSQPQREHLMAYLSLTRKAVSSLRMAVQTHLKYPSNPQAEAGKLQVLDQIVRTLNDLRSVLENGPPTHLDTEEPGHFVHHIDQVLEGLGEQCRYDLCADMEVWVCSIVRHAMGVAHLCQGTYRHLITRTCQRILQSKFRLFELQAAVLNCPNLTDVRFDYEEVCESLMDEVCELEKHVNMGLLNIIVDTVCFTSQPLEQLASHALHHQEDRVARGELEEEFLRHGERLCQVAAMASASSMDPKKVRYVMLITSRLEQLMPEVPSAVDTVSRHHGNVAAVRHLKALVQEWVRETEALVRTLDTMMDPTMVLHVTEQRMRQGVNVVRGKVCEGDREGVREGVRRLLAHALRMTQVAHQVIDQHTDAIFRNGLRVYAQQLLTARRGVKEASEVLLDDLGHSRLADTLHRRLALFIDAATDVRQGVKADNHVDILNPARLNVYGRQGRVPPQKPPRVGKAAVKATVGTGTDKADNTKPTATNHADTACAACGHLPSGGTDMPSREATVSTPSTHPPTASRHTTTTSASVQSHTVTAPPAAVEKCGCSHTTAVPVSEPIERDCGVSCASVAPPSSAVGTMSNCENCRPATTVKCAVSAPAVSSATAAKTSCCSASAAAVNGAEANTSCGSGVGVKVSEEEGGGGGSARRKGGGGSGGDQKNKRRSEESSLQKGDTSGLVWGVGDGVVASALRGEKGAVGRWSSDVLGWTSHLGEAALSIVNHCHNASRKTEIRQLVTEVDRLAPLLMEAARFVSAGDHSQTDALRLLADDWINACQRLVIMVEVAVGDWHLLMDNITQAVADHDTSTLKSLLSSLDRTQREMHQLLTRAQRLEGRQVAGGLDMVNFFREADPELDNLTATLKTTADCLATSGEDNPVTRMQLNQRGREWCVLMTCVVSGLDRVTSALSNAGQTTLGVPPSSLSPSSVVLSASCQHSRLVPALRAETQRLKDVLAALSAGCDSAVKQRSESLSQALSALLEEVVEVSLTSVDDPALLHPHLFTRLDAGLVRSRWTEKALDAVQFVQRHCHKYCVPITNLLHCTPPSGVEGVCPELRQLQGVVGQVSQRTLQVIQLSPDLQHRATIRRCLDQLLAMMPSIAEAATDYLAGLGGEKGARDVQRASQLWGATVHCLISTLRAMDSVKPAAINELDKQLSGHSAVETVTTSTSQPPPAVSSSKGGSGAFPSLSPRTPRDRQHTSSCHGETQSSPWRERGRQRDAPSVAGAQSAGGAHTPVRSTHELPEGEGERPMLSMSPYRSSALYTSWLASAQYLEEEVDGWEDDDHNRFVRLVKSMAQHCQHMADFTRGGTSLKDSEEVATTGLSLAASGQELLTFVHSLLAMCPHHRSGGDLQKAADKISTCSKQLHMVATLLYNSPGHPQGDCFLARNASNLVDAVRHMFSIAEGMAVAGELTEREGNETDQEVVDLLTRWQHKLATYHAQQSHNPQRDSLGLRRMELHRPPSLTSLLDA